MSSKTSAARSQGQMIEAALNGSSSSVQTLGNIGTDPHPERLLAVGLAHAMNAIGALVGAVDALESEVASLRSRIG